MPIKINPRRIPGRWRLGYALDLHTTSSIFQGHDEYGHPMFETTRSEAGELLYELKYRGDPSGVADLVEAAAGHLQGWAVPLDVVVAVPPSKHRAIQPVHLLGTGIAKRLGVPFRHDIVYRTRELPELKSVYDYDERLRLLAGAHATVPDSVLGQRVLLFDDLYRSGASMNAIAELLYNHGGAADIVALTITQTRSNR